MIINNVPPGESSGRSLSHIAQPIATTDTQYLKMRHGSAMTDSIQPEMSHLAIPQTSQTTTGPRNIKNTSRHVTLVIHSIMVNPFLKVSRGRSLDSIGTGLTALMHRHDTGITEPALPVIDNALVSSLDVVVAGRLPKSPISKVSGSIKQRICNVFIHGRIVAGLAGFLYSHFPIPVFFVHGVTVCAGKR